MKQVYDLEIAGASYRIASQYDRPYMDGLASLLTDRIESLSASLQGRSSHQMMMLVALELVDELCQLKNRVSSEQKEIRADLDAFLVAIDEKLERVRSLDRTD